MTDQESIIYQLERLKDAKLRLEVAEKHLADTIAEHYPNGFPREVSND